MLYLTELQPHGFVLVGQFHVKLRVPCSGLAPVAVFRL